MPAIETLLRASFAALPPGGTVVDYDAHLGGEGDAPVAAYSVLLMHSTEGRCYAVDTIAGLMRSAGFVDVDVRLTAADRSAIVARRP